MGKFTIREKNEKFSFRLKAGNGEVIATSQMYKSLKTCKAGIASVKANAPIAALENQRSAVTGSDAEFILTNAEDYEVPACVNRF